MSLGLCRCHSDESDAEIQHRQRQDADAGEEADLAGLLTALHHQECGRRQRYGPQRRNDDVADDAHRAVSDAQFLCKHRGQLYAGIVHRVKAVGNT